MIFMIKWRLGKVLAAITESENRFFLTALYLELGLWAYEHYGISKFIIAQISILTADFDFA